MFTQKPLKLSFSIQRNHDEHLQLDEIIGNDPMPVWMDCWSLGRLDDAILFG
jgi:hypothetical protein